MRQNYGVVFERMKSPLRIQSTSIDLVLVTRYSLQPPPVTRSSLVEIVVRLYSNFRMHRNNHYFLSLAKHVDYVKQSLGTRMRKLFHTVTKMLQNPISETAARKKRAGAPLAFIGDLASGFFGLATQDSVGKIVNHIKHLDTYLNKKDLDASKLNDLISKLAQQQANSALTIRAQQGLFTGMFKNVSSVLQNWSKNVSSSVRDVNTLVDTNLRATQAFLAALAEVSSYLQYTHYYSQFLTSLQTLNTQRLPPHLIPPTDLQRSVTAVKNQATKTLARGTLLTDNLNHLYNHPISAFLYSRTHLYIHVQVPIYLPTSVLSLFNVRILPVPFHTNEPGERGYTRLDTDIEMLAITTSEKYYIEIQKDTLRSCVRSDYIVCPKPLSMTPQSSPSCIMAIHQNKQQLIRKLCHFKAHPKAVLPASALAISGNTFLISNNQQNYELQCPGKAVHNRACAYCFISLPCDCSMKSANLYVPAAALECKLNATTSTFQHTINLPVAYSFDLPTNFFAGDSTHPAPLLLSIPNISMAMRKMTDITDEQVKQGVDLVDLAKAVQRNSTRFFSYETDDSLPKIVQQVSHPYVIIASVILTCLLAVAVIYLLAKVQRLATLIPLIAHTRAAPVFNHSLPFLLTAQPATTTTQSSTLIDIDDYQAHLLSAILAILIIYILIKSIIAFKHSLQRRPDCAKSNPSLFLKIYSSKMNFLVKLREIEYESNLLGFDFAPDLLRIEQDPFCQRRLLLTWSDDLHISLQGQPWTISLPKAVSVPLLMKRSMLKSIKRNTQGHATFSAGLILKDPFNPPKQVPPKLNAPQTTAHFPAPSAPPPNVDSPPAYESKSAKHDQVTDPLMPPTTVRDITYGHLRALLGHLSNTNTNNWLTELP